jgi:hypothetical protein
MIGAALISAALAGQTDAVSQFCGQITVQMVLSSSLLVGVSGRRRPKRPRILGALFGCVTAQDKDWAVVAQHDSNDPFAFMLGAEQEPPTSSASPVSGSIPESSYRRGCKHTECIGGLRNVIQDWPHNPGESRA